MCSQRSLLFFVLLMAAFVLACECVHVPLTRNTQKRQTLLKQARDHFGLSEDQRLPAQYKIHTGGRNSTSSARSTTSYVALYGGLSFGEVYAAFTLGTPAQSFTAQVDTGSSDLGVPVGPCSSCGHPKHVYHPRKSTTSASISCATTQFQCPECHSSNKCGYSISYLDGSGFQANLHTDVMTIGGLTITGQSVGCIRKEISNGGFEPSGVDGILGLAYSSISETASPTFMDTLVSSGQVDDIFSICLNDNGGALELGGLVQSFNVVPQYTALVQPLKFYQVVMNDFLVGGVSLNLPSSTYNKDGTIFDSGTTSLAVPTVVYQGIFDALVASCVNTPLVGICGARQGRTLFDGYCYQMTTAEVAMFPNLQITLAGDVTLDIPPQSWILDGYCSKPGYFSVLVDPIDQDAVILGDVVHRIYTVIYDRANSQIGVAATTSCPSS